MTRTDILNRLIKKHDIKTYLEIGVQEAVNISGIECPYKVGVDIREFPEGDWIRYTCPSDDFFLENHEKFDLIFVDGLHLYEQAKFDIINAMDALTDTGFIAMHDTYPKEKAHQARTPKALTWNGDVWRVVYDMHQAKMTYWTHDTDHGVTIIPRQEISTEFIESFCEMDFDEFLPNANAILKVKRS